MNPTVVQIINVMAFTCDGFFIFALGFLVGVFCEERRAKQEAMKQWGDLAVKHIKDMAEDSIRHLEEAEKLLAGYVSGNKCDWCLGREEVSACTTCGEVEDKPHAFSSECVYAFVRCPKCS